MPLRLARLFRLRAFILLLLILTFALVVIASPVHAATLPGNFTETLIASGLSSPTAFAFAPDGRIFVTEQGGAVRVLKNNVLQAPAFVTVPTTADGERGLLGITLDSEFSTNVNKQFVYVYYTASTPVIHNRLSRFTASGDVATGPETILLELEDLGPKNHNGGALHFGNDGKLYVAVGENGSPANSQTLNNRLGKILRINSDGSIPADNPFSASSGNPNGTATGNNLAIWAIGLRNPFTFAFQPTTGRLFINDVGQTTWEEMNDGIAGSNYGWNTCEGFCSPSNASFRDPLLAYSHSTGDFTGCAIVGGAFYNPTTVVFPADYVGDYFFADLCGGWIRRYDIATKTSTAFAGGIPSPVDLHVSPDGTLYYLAIGGGQVKRVTYNAPVNTPTNTSTRTRTPVNTATHTRTRTKTPVNTATFTPTRTNTMLNTATSTRTKTPTPRPTRTRTPTRTTTPVASPTPTRTNTPVATATTTRKPTRTRTNTPSPTATATPTRSGVWIFCANASRICSFPGTRRVRFGANGSYNIKIFTDSVLCSKAAFGDPLPGVPKHCDYEQ